MHRSIIIGLALMAPLFVGAQAPAKLCALVTPADMSVVGATMNVKSLFGMDMGSGSGEVPGTPKALTDAARILCTEREDQMSKLPARIVFHVATKDVGADVWNQSISSGAKYLEDKGMATVSIKSPGQASCFVTSKEVMKQSVGIERGQAQCFGFKGKVMVQMVADDGVDKQEALAKKLKEVVELILKRL